MASSQDIYKEIGYESNKIGFGKKPGIAVVDFQLGFTDSKYDLGGLPMVERAVENTARLLKAGRAAQLPPGQPCPLPGAPCNALRCPSR